jgi:hypothetical protein
MRLLIKIAVPCLLVGVAIYGCVSLISQNIPIRFQLTVEVTDGEQIRSGSSVLEVEYPIVPDSLNIGTSSFRRVVGYAVTVDLGQKGLLFLTFLNAHRTSKQIIELNKRIFFVPWTKYRACRSPPTPVQEVYPSPQHPAGRRRRLINYCAKAGRATSRSSHYLSSSGFSTSTTRARRGSFRRSTSQPALDLELSSAGLFWSSPAARSRPRPRFGRSG